LRQQIARATDPGWKQARVFVRALIGDVHQFGAQHRIGQGCCGLYALHCGIGLMARCRKFRVVLARIFQQPGEIRTQPTIPQQAILGCTGRQQPCSHQPANH
jgi:hypothetical protein